MQMKIVVDMLEKVQLSQTLSSPGCSLNMTHNLTHSLFLGFNGPGMHTAQCRAPEFDVYIQCISSLVLHTISFALQSQSIKNCYTIW